MDAVTTTIPTTSRAERSRETLLAAVDSLRPLVERHRASLAAGPDLPKPIADALIAADFAQLWLPQTLAGPEVHPLLAVEVIEALAKLDASVAWCASISSGGAARFMGQMKADAVGSLIPPGGKFAGSGSGKPTGTAVRDGDGWRISGRWSWASFSRYSTVSALMCVELEDGRPRQSPDGRPVTRGVFVSSDKVTVEGNWNAGGLRSSGSHDVSCDSVWVPDEHTIDGNAVMMPQGLDPLYMLPMTTAAGIMAIGIPLGIAAASIEALIELAPTKTPFGASDPLHTVDGAQIGIARAQAELDAARAAAMQVVRDVWDEAERGRPVTVEQQTALRQACWNAGNVAKKVVASMYELAGSDAVLEELPFAGQLRDIYAVCQHIGFQERLLLAPGRVLFGLAPGVPFI